MDGWTGNILKVDLNLGKIEKICLDISVYRMFLGGRGINSKLLYDAVDETTEPFSSENIIVFGSGPLAGTLAPSCSRCTVTAKSPLTGILGDANFGGFFSAHMKKAGYDHIVITGKSDRPVHLVISGDDVQIRDAAHLWGLTIPAAEKVLKKEPGPKFQHALIGPAGENRVYTACVSHRFNVAGRTGMGAVMGDKKLKAVSVFGKGKVAVAHEERFQQEREKWRQKIKENPFCKFFGEYGSAGPLDREEEAGILAVKNFSQTCGFERVEQVSAGYLKKYLTRSHACFVCPVHCIQSFEVTDGPYRGTKGTKMPEGCNSACGPSCGNADPGSLFKLNNLANAYGIDILDFGLLMSVAMDWYENGIITDRDTDNISLNWGNHESMVMMLEKIARREGIGNILADGAVKAARHIGRNAEMYVSACKGMMFGGVDPRVLRGSALCYATASRGGDHLRGGLLYELPSKDGKSAMPVSEAEEKFGTADVLMPLSYNKATAANYSQDMYTVSDCLEVCKFITAHGSDAFGITLQDMRDMLHAVTGLDMHLDGLRVLANRVFTLERMFLVREGVNREDDFLHGKWTCGPVTGGRYDGAEIDRQKWDEMLEAYYESRGWDGKTGVPKPETLRALGLV